MPINWKLLSQKIDQSQKIVLTTHVRPDGDGLGSEAALFSYFERIGKIVRIINVSPLPDVFNFLNDDSKYEMFNTEIHANFIQNADCIIILDCNHSSRLEEMSELVCSTNGEIIIIDHHLNPEDFAHHYFIDPSYCSTGEMVYDFISYHSGMPHVSKIAAEGIYTAIMTDTGNFRFPRTTAEVHRKVAYLLESGADPYSIYHEINEQKTYEALQFFGYFVSQIKTAYQGKLAYCVLRKADFERFHAAYDDTEGFVQQLLSIKSVDMGIIIIEQPYGYKLSFRSRGEINVNDFAALYNGGGHKNASGGKLLELSDTAIQNLIMAAEPFLFVAEPI